MFKIQKFIPGNIAKIKWVSKKNLHITLKFIGLIDKNKIKEIEDRLIKVKFYPFKLKLDKIGFFLSDGNPKIIRLSFLNESDINNLQKKIDAEILDIISNDQKFSSHLTLGRIKMVKKQKDFLEKIKKFEFIKNEFEINNFKLMESKLTRDGPKYKIISIFKA